MPMQNNFAQRAPDLNTESRYIFVVPKDAHIFS